MALLARWSGRTDILLGTPVANRQPRETESLIGFFVNTLVLRADLGGAPTFRQLLGRVRQVAFEAYEHQNLPFEQLVDALQPERDLAMSPLFQVLFVLQNAPAGKLELPGLTLEQLPYDNAVAKFDLSLSVTEIDGDLEAALEHNSDIFDPTTIERMVIQLGQLLRGLLAEPGGRIFDVGLLTGAQRHQLVSEWNDTATGEPPGVLAGFERQAESHPHRLALELGRRQLSYGELAERTLALALELRGRGVGVDTRVGLCVERGVDLIVGLLGILRAGAAYVALDPALPSERLRFLLEDSGASVLVVSGATRGRFEGTGLPLVAAGSAPPATPSSREPLPRIESAMAAYVLFTSGSTGRPKGVVLGHGALAHLLAWQARRTPGSWRTLQYQPASFDVSFQEILSTLAGGGTLVLVDDEERRDPRALHRQLVSRRVERLFLPTVALSSLVEAGREAPATLRHVIVAGEALRLTPDLRSWFDARPGLTLDNQYGPTESHVVTAHRMPPWPQASPPIGRPTAGSRVRVLDPGLRSCPIGVPGELCIGGVSPARGYARRPRLTAERFVPDPRGLGRGARLYRTGDLTRLLADGRIEYLGRIDQQVKIRGYRVEPGEIEAALTELPEIREAAVRPRRGASGVTSLAAYVVAVGEAPDWTSVRERLRDWLPDYMVPGLLLALDALPLTTSGKIDGRALAALSAAAPGPSRRPPVTSTERALAAVWSELLEFDEIGRDDDFFELGGHSLLATQVISRIRLDFGVELPLRVLFEAATLRRLAEQLDFTVVTLDRLGSVPVEEGEYEEFEIA